MLEILRRRVARFMWLPVAFWAVGCVSLQSYNQTKSELEKAKEANADLVKKYNQAMQRLLAKERETGGDADLQAQLLRLQRENDELRKQSVVQPGFTPEEIKKIGAEAEEGGLRLGEALLFAEGSNKLRPEASGILDGIVELLQTKYRDDMIIIEGHTDNQPLVKTRDVWKFNIRLGYERAQAVFEYFLDHGIPESRVVVRAYSFNKPTDKQDVDSKEARTRNRRVVVRRGGTQI